LINDIVGRSSGPSYLAQLSTLDDGLNAANPQVSYSAWIEEISSNIRSLEGPSLMKSLFEDLRESADKVKDATPSTNFFYKIWAAVDFVCCVPEVAGDRTVRYKLYNAVRYSVTVCSLQDVHFCRPLDKRINLGVKAIQQSW
jgi:hypothetical protein